MIVLEGLVGSPLDQIPGCVKAVAGRDWTAEDAVVAVVVIQGRIGRVFAVACVVIAEGFKSGQARVGRNSESVIRRMLRCTGSDRSK